MSSILLYDVCQPEVRERFSSLIEDPLLQAVFSRSQRLSVPVYLVGGVVRDLLMGRPLHDVDLVVPAPRERFEQLLEAVTGDVPTTWVDLDPERGVIRLVPKGAGESTEGPESAESALAGSMVEHLDFALGQGEDLVGDLSMRDLTLNAMALDRHGRLYDPFGGFEDLQERRLKEVAPEAFQDDPLRCLRALRFSALLAIDLAPTTVDRMIQARPLLDGVAGERIADELFAFLSAESCPASTPESRLWERALFGKEEQVEPLGWESYRRWCGSAEAASLHEEEPVRQGRSLAALVGLGVLLGVERLSDPGRRDSVFERLRLSRREAAYLVQWGRGFPEVAALASATAEPTAEDLWLLKKEIDVALPGAWAAFLAVDPQVSALQVRQPERFPRLGAVAHGWGELREGALPFQVAPFLARSGRQPGPWVRDLIVGLETDWRCGRVDGPDELSARADRYLAELDGPSA